MTKTITRKSVASTLRSMSRRLGHSPSRAEYRNKKAMSAPASSTIETVAGSWSRALRLV